MNTATNQQQPYQDTSFPLSIRILLCLLVVLSMSFTLLPSGFNWGQIDNPGNLSAGSLFFQIQFGSLFLIGTIIAWHYRQWNTPHLRHINPFLLLMILYCALSTAWSPEPVTTIKRVVQLSGLLLVGLAISPPVTRKHFLTNMMLITFTVLQVLSVIAVLVFPSISIETNLDDAWRGILSQKNALGAISALSFILWLSQAFSKKLSMSICIYGMVFSFFMLIMSKSTTSLMMCMLCCTVYLVARRRYMKSLHDKFRFLLILLILIVVPLHIFFVLMGRLPTWSEIFYPVQYLTGKSADLTGRTNIWALILTEIQRHPILGLGYGAFWLGPGSKSQFIITLLGWTPLQSHNGYLDIINELGYIGIGLLVMIFVYHAFQLTQLTRVDREEAARHWAFFVLIVISNFSESEIFRGVAFQTILFIFSAVSVAAQLNVHRAAMLQNSHRTDMQAT